MPGRFNCSLVLIWIKINVYFRGEKLISLCIDQVFKMFIRKSIFDCYCLVLMKLLPWGYSL